MIDSLITRAQKALDSDTCLCEEPKQKGTCFCMRCFLALPGRMRFHLHKTYSEGFAEYFDQSCDFLRQETDRIKP